MTNYAEKLLKFQALGPFYWQDTKRYSKEEKAMKPGCDCCGTSRAYFFYILKDKRNNTYSVGDNCFQKLTILDSSQFRALYGHN